MIDNLKKQSTLILGMGREGWSTYKFLRNIFPDKKLALADASPIEKNKELIEKDQNLTTYFGENYLDNLSEYQVIFKSPGIPQTLPEIADAKENGCKLTSNTQLFFELCPGITIGVTGTKGKSTTSAVIHQVLKENDLDAHLVGNIGQPSLEILDELNSSSLIVCELSSHQLETMTISPHISVVQDVTSEHLDYYENTEKYQQAKKAIAKFQKQDDFVIFNPQMKGASDIAKLSAGKHLRFSIDEGPDALVFVRNSELIRKDSNQRTELILPTKKLPLYGEHNILNVMPAIIIGTLFNLSAEQIGNALKNFKSLPHRLELVHERKGISYYNDSLATMPEAAVKALDSFDKPIVLIAGGYERNQDFSNLAKKIVEKEIVGLVLFEPTGKRIEDEIKKLGGQINISFATEMREAVGKSQQMMTNYLEKNSKTEGIVLLSPGSASFGMFKDYQDRGEQFKEAVKTII